MNHEWDLKDICKHCSISKEDYHSTAEWYALFCPGAPESYRKSASDCCEFPVRIFLGNKWYCETCGKNKEDESVPLPTTYNRCTCGALHTSKVNNHSPWCDIKVK